MKRRRGKVEITAVGTATEERPLRPHEIAAGLAAAQPVQTSAHTVAGPTPCVVCGGPAERTEDTWGPWRKHRHCAGLMAYPTLRIEAACRALAIGLESDADLVPYVVSNYASTHREPTWTDEPTRLRLPWRHVDRKELERAVARLPELRAQAGRIEVECTEGWCAWCGVSESKGWFSRGHRWPDGASAPLCSSCATVYDSGGEVDPSWWDGQRALLAQALTGVPQPMGNTPPAGLRAYAESQIETADGTPWSHLPAEAVEGFRWAAWGLYRGRYAPPEHRSEALRRAEAAQAAKQAHRVAQDAQEAARADVYGFAGPR